MENRLKEGLGWDQGDGLGGSTMYIVEDGGLDQGRSRRGDKC